MMKIVCQACGIEGYLQHIGKNYYRIRHYVGFKNGKPVFKYQSQEPEYVHKLLRQKGRIDHIGQNNIDLTGHSVDHKLEGNTFKFECKPSVSSCSGSIVRSSIAASRHNAVKESRRPGFKSRPEHHICTRFARNFCGKQLVYLVLREFNGISRILST
jgi:hypothetical protein